MGFFDYRNPGSPLRRRLDAEEVERLEAGMDTMHSTASRLVDVAVRRAAAGVLSQRQEGRLADA